MRGLVCLPSLLVEYAWLLTFLAEIRLNFVKIWKKRQEVDKCASFCSESRSAHFSGGYF